MKTALLIVWLFAIPALLLVAAVIAAVQGEWGAAGVCALFAVLLAGFRAL